MTLFFAGMPRLATKEDLKSAQDLIEMLMARRESCIGQAANMAGIPKRIIHFLMWVENFLHTQSCLISKLLRRMQVMMQEQAGCCLLETIQVQMIRDKQDSVSDIRNIGMDKKTSLVGRHRSFNTKLITVMEF